MIRGQYRREGKRKNKWRGGETSAEKIGEWSEVEREEEKEE